MILLFQHGWGFDATFWQELAGLLPEWPAQFDDRGYFGTPKTPEPTEPCVLIAHSFGAMRALAAPPTGCRGLVAINGFDRFTARDGQVGVSPRVVQRMLSRFDSDPVTTLEDFRRRCGTDGPFGHPDAARLREDLLALHDGDETEKSARWPHPLLSLQGAHDPLLPLPMRSEVFSETSQLERLTHPAGGHLIPISDAPYCARAIRAFVEHAA